KKGYILSYDDQNNSYYPIVSLDNAFDHVINERFLSLASRISTGILINKNYSDVYSSSYLEFLKEDVKGIICVPITSQAKNSEIDGERRKNAWEEHDIKGFVYLETDNVFNRFDYERLKVVKML